MATVKGTAKTDKITVNASNVIVVTGKKTTSPVISKNGNNKIFGAAAKDTFTVKGGKHNYIYGDKGNDTITVTSKIGSGNKIYGDDAKNKVSGNDTFHIKGGNKNYFYGGKGNDTFNITGGNGNTLYGEAGADVFKFGSKNWKVTIGEINAEDTLDFSSYKGDYGATMSQSGKNLSISFNKYVGDTQTKIGVINLKNYFAKQGNRFKCVRYNPETKKKQKVTVIAGGNNTRNVSGTNGSDWIITGNGDKKTNAGKGNDMIQVGWGDAGSNGTQIINAGSGDDEIYADGGKNTLNGEDGNDIIFVENTNNNTLNGGNGDDILEVYGNGHSLNGGEGNDILIVNSGNNTVLNGGAGKDTFIFGKNGSGTIKDYKAGQDTLEFSSGVVTSTKLSGKDNIVFMAGSASATLAGVAQEVIRLKDKRGSYIMYGTGIVLGNDFKGAISTDECLSTVKTVNACDTTNDVTITGSEKGGYFTTGSGNKTVNAGGGKDEIYVGYGFNSNKIAYGTQTINAGDGDNYIEVTAFSQKSNKITINGGKDMDEIWINDVNSKNITIDGGGGFNRFNLSGTGHTVIGDAGSDNYEIKGTGHVLKNVGGGDNIDIVESMAGRNLTIERKFYADDIDNEDVIYFRSDAVEDMKFATSDDLLTITHKNGGGLSISNWDSERTLLIIFGDYSDPAYDRFTIGTNVKVQGATPG